MTNITDEVKYILSTDLAVQSCLARGLINTRGLAKLLIKKHQINASVDSVISAIRRFDAGCAMVEHNSKVKEIFSHAPIKTRTNLVVVEVTGRNNIQKCINKLNSIVNLDRGETLRIVKGGALLRIIMDEQNLPNFDDILLEENDVEVIKDVVELSIKTNPDIDVNATKGVMARISNELALNNVNIAEVIFSLPIIMIYVDRKDYVRAHSALLGLTLR